MLGLIDQELTGDGSHTTFSIDLVGPAEVRINAFAC
jgi:hypothetical protein